MFRQAVRKKPTQERGKRRVEAILDAAAVVFVEEGFDQATMDQIAARADSSVGSIYQFFPNKLEIFKAIAESALQTSVQMFAGIATPDAIESGWDAVLSAFMDGYLHWERSDPRVRALYANLHLYRTYEEDDMATLQILVDRTTELLAVFVPLPKKKRELIAVTIINVMSGFLFLARIESDTRAKQMLEETKVLLIRYLRPYTDQP